MKLRNLIFLASAPFLLAACLNIQDEPSGTPGSVRDGSGGRGSGSIDNSPGIGMSQNQIRDIYGEPDSVDRSPCCEVWYYWFKNCRVPIPGDFRSRARTGIFIFGNNGKLKDFGYNQ
jgi:hypothetical protein